jgi:hypothetical protein
MASPLDGIQVSSSHPELRTAVRAITAKFSAFIRQRETVRPTGAGTGKTYAQAVGTSAPASRVQTNPPAARKPKPKTPPTLRERVPDKRLLVRLPEELITASRNYTLYAIGLAILKEVVALGCIEMIYDLLSELTVLCDLKSYLQR